MDAQETDPIRIYKGKVGEIMMEVQMIKPLIGPFQEEIAILRSYLHEALAGHDILEIACGTGYWTEVIAHVARSVVATDLSHETLIEAGTKIYPPGRVRFEIAVQRGLGCMGSGFFMGLTSSFCWPAPLRGRERRCRQSPAHPHSL